MLKEFENTMASITYGWNLETILRVHGIGNEFSQLKQSSTKEYNQKLKDSIPSLTKNEARMRDAIRRGDVKVRYYRHWVDQDGKTHWDY